MLPSKMSANRHDAELNILGTPRRLRRRRPRAVLRPPAPELTAGNMLGGVPIVNMDSKTFVLIDSSSKLVASIVDEDVQAAMRAEG